MFKWRLCSKKGARWKKKPRSIFYNIKQFLVLKLLSVKGKTKQNQTQKSPTCHGIQSVRKLSLSLSDNLALFILTGHEPHSPTLPRGPQPICSHLVSSRQLGDKKKEFDACTYPTLSGWRYQGRFCDVTTSHSRRLADTKVLKQVTQQAMTSNKSLLNYISPKSFQIILQTNLKQEI